MGRNWWHKAAEVQVTRECSVDIGWIEGPNYDATLWSLLWIYKSHNDLASHVVHLAHVDMRPKVSRTCDCS